MKKQFTFFLCVACMMIGFSVSAAETFDIGYLEFKPYIWTENNEPKGIYVDVLKEALEKRLKIQIRFEALPVKRIARYIEKGKLDGFIEVSTSERLKYSKTGRVPVAMGLVGAFTYKNHPKISDLADLDTLSDLKPYRILSHRGDDWTKENLKEFEVDLGARDIKSALLKLKSKRGDLLLQIEQVAQFNIKQLNYEKDIVQLPNIVLNPILYKLLISQKSTFINILPTLDKILTAMLNEGTTANIYKKYRGNVIVDQVLGTNKPKVRFIHYATTGIMPDTLDEIAAEFNKKQKQYRMRAIPMDMESYKQSIKVMLIGGKPSDMLLTWAGYRTKYLVDSGFIEPIDDIWKKEEMNALFPIATATGMTYNGHKYAIPLTHHIVPFFYNKRIFEANGIVIPKTWDDFLRACENLKSKGITPIALGSKERWPAIFWFDYLLIRTAGHIYRERLMSGNASYNDPQVKKVFNLWKDLINRGFFNKNYNSVDYNEASKMVRDGKAAMTLNGTWTIGVFENVFNWKSTIDFDIFTFPQIDPNIPNTVVGVMDVILRTKAGNLKAAGKAMAHFADSDGQMRFTKATGALAPNKKIPLSFYSPILQKVMNVINKTPIEVFGYDLATPPHVAEIGLTAFKKFLENPDQYLKLLRETDKAVKNAFKITKN